MDVNFLYNWPPGEGSVRVSLGAANIDDQKYDFRVGLTKKDENNKVFWLKPNWFEVKEEKK